MIPSRPELNYLFGSNLSEEPRPSPPFGDLQCEFLDALSAALRQDVDASLHSDVMAFAFWCRKGNILRLRDEFKDGRERLGLGRVFHIAPSNVPVNFAFSYVFGLLAGNANYVRVPSKNFLQVEVIGRVLGEVLDRPQFRALREVSHFFRYGHQADITAEISAQCMGRLIWGGDETIREIRKSPIQLRGVDLAFADRYSFCCLGAQELAAWPGADFDRLARGFYNDTYLMDQNACSSPHLVVWLGTAPDAAIAKEKFWSAVSRIVHEKYVLSSKAAIDKQTLFCQNAIDLQDIRSVDIRDTSLFRIELGSLPEHIEAIRGNSGYFYEYQTENLDSVAGIVTPAYQTLTYAGLNKAKLMDFTLRNRLTGIDRIVPVGTALDIGIIWDGHDVIRSLSRIIDIR